MACPRSHSAWEQRPGASSQLGARSAHDRETVESLSAQLVSYGNILHGNRGWMTQAFFPEKLSVPIRLQGMVVLHVGGWHWQMIIIWAFLKAPSC